ncbi:hypothetical protein WN51_05031 [Melipona quadrifasciata]|uniref:Uncharacterized protein n=1 Tax=Melipona quadrifasciata TaxID=166423 RepID=A0A0M8ZTN4_9HYME|nr:hypothetical protein WN51_05031 [Melipona quadrifasciata]
MVPSICKQLAKAKQKIFEIHVLNTGEKCKVGCTKVHVIPHQYPPAKRPEEEMLSLKTRRHIMPDNLKNTLEIEFKAARNYIPLPEPGPAPPIIVPKQRIRRKRKGKGKRYNLPTTYNNDLRYYNIPNNLVKCGTLKRQNMEYQNFMLRVFSGSLVNGIISSTKDKIDMASMMISHETWPL